LEYKSKRVLVTGAVGQLGKQFCKQFAKNDAKVFVSDLNINDCSSLIEELPNSKIHTPLKLDVGDPSSVKEAFKKIKKISNSVDIIINNAGIAVFSPFEKRGFEDFMKVMRVNTGGTFLCIQEGSNLMRKTKTKGCIINIGSIYGVMSGDPRIYSEGDRKTSECYGASKAAIIHMTKYFGVHLANYGIRVNCISPGGVKNNQDIKFINNYSYRSPMGRMAEETEIAGTALFLSSDNAKYITGQNILVDGGWTSW